MMKLEVQIEAKLVQSFDSGMAVKGWIAALRWLWIGLGAQY